MRHLLIFAILLIPLAVNAEPMMQRLQRDCIATGGSWVKTPEWCGNLEPQILNNLSVKQREYCVKVVKTRCFCPDDKRFQITKELNGCLPDRFKIEQEKWDKIYNPPKPKPDYDTLFGVKP